MSGPYELKEWPTSIWHSRTIVLDEGCRVDTQPNHWFRCHRGTVGCPRIHDGLTPHCMACAAGEECPYKHDPPALEESEAV